MENSIQALDAGSKEAVSAECDGKNIRTRSLSCSDGFLESFSSD
jgi:hypothetical protein